MELVKEEPEAREPAAVTEGKSAPPLDQPRVASRSFKQAYALLLLAALAYGGFQVSHRYVVQIVQVSGVSMSPTLPEASWYFLNRFIYHFREPRLGDIVVLRDPQDQGNAIKRIIAKPGDAVYIKNGHVYVNGELLNEPYLKAATETYASPDYQAQYWVCGAGYYFMLGDNRYNSTDSRIYGTVPRENILGLVMH